MGFLTESQKRIASNALSVLAFAIVVVFVAFVAWAVLKFAALTSAALIPVMLGFFLSLFFKPYYLWWKRMLKNPTLALIVMLATVFIPLGTLLWYAGAVLIDQFSHLVAQGPALTAQVIAWLEKTLPNFHSLLNHFGVSFASMGEFYTRYGDTAIKAGSNVLKFFNGLLTLLFSLLFFVVFLISKDRRGGEIVSHMPFLKSTTKEFLAEQIDAFFDILVSFFQRQVIICLIEGVMYGVGFWLVGLPYGFLIGFALGVINLVPLFGSLICLPIALPLAYFPHGGSLTRLLMVLGVWLLGQFLDGYLITPKIQGNKTGLGYAGVIFSFFFWATILGPVLGMLLAIPLSAFCVVFWRALKSKYIRPIV